MSTTDKLVDYTYELAGSDLPAEARSNLKTALLDTLGAMAAGSTAPAAEKAFASVLDGADGIGTVPFMDESLSLPEAGLLNAVLSRGFDFEPVLSKGATHVLAPVVPAALAFAEHRAVKLDDPVDGEEFLAAIAAGTELNWRIRVAGGTDTAMSSGWIASTFSPIAVAAMGGKLLGLSREQVACAMGIGYNRCAGTYGSAQGAYGGYMAQLSAGMAASAGIESALMAAEGITASPAVFDDEFGLYEMYGEGTYDEDVLVGNLGTNYEFLQPKVKRYPGCGATQPVVTATRELVEEHKIRSDDIDAVTIRAGMNSYRLCGKNKQRPETTADALWNHRYSCAVTLIDGPVFVDDFMPDAIHRPEITALLDVIDVEPDDDLEKTVAVEIATNSGSTYRTVNADFDWMNDTEVAEKFEQCARHARDPLTPGRIETVVETVHAVELMDDVSDLYDLL